MSWTRGARAAARRPHVVVVPKGRGADAALGAASPRRASLELLEDYFDRPYPYAKLDQVAIPGSASRWRTPAS